MRRTAVPAASCLKFFNLHARYVERISGRGCHPDATSRLLFVEQTNVACQSYTSQQHKQALKNGRDHHKRTSNPGAEAPQICYDFDRIAIQAETRFMLGLRKLGP